MGIVSVIKQAPAADGSSSGKMVLSFFLRNLCAGGYKINSYVSEKYDIIELQRALIKWHDGRRAAGPSRLIIMRALVPAHRNGETSRACHIRISSLSSYHRAANIQLFHGD